MEEIEICKAQKEDMPYIEEKIKKYLLDGKDISCDQFFVAKNRGKTVAFCRIIDRLHFFELATLGVDYYHRNRGIGIKMINFLVEEAKRRDGRKPIYGVTHIPDYVAKAGFKVVSEYPEALEYKRKRKDLFRDQSRVRVMRFI